MDFDFFLNTFFVLFAVCFVTIAAFIGIAIYKTVSEWLENNKLPITSIPAIVRGKNSETMLRSHSHASSQDHMHDQHIHSSTDRTVTFENTMTNARYVFAVDRDLFDRMFEGDMGVLVHQGTKFHNFVHQ